MNERQLREYRMSANNTIEMNITELTATAIAYDPNAPMANLPMAIIDEENVTALPPDDEEVQMVKDLDGVEEFIGILFDEGEISDYAYTELGGLFELIKQNKWYKKIERRMEARPRRPREQFTEIDKLNDPRRRTCPDCNARVINLKDHQGRKCCVREATKLVLRATKEKKVSALMTAATLDLNDSILRMEKYKQQIRTAQEELEEEEYETATIEDDTEDEDEDN